MSLLIKFSKYIVVPVLTEWLCLSDFIHLTTAATNSGLLPQLKSLCWEFPKHFEKLFIDECLVYSDACMYWLENYRLFHINAELTSTILKVIQVRQAKDVTVDIVRKWLGCFTSRLVNNANKYSSVSHNSVGDLKFDPIRSWSCGPYKSSTMEDYTTIVNIINSSFNLSQLTIKRTMITPYILGNLRQDLPIQSLSLLAIHNLSCYSSLFRSCSNLMELKISSTPVLQQWIITIVVWCRRLQVLDVSLSPSSEEGTRMLYVIAFHGGLQLTKLNVFKMRNLCLETLLWYRCSDSLTHLNLGRTSSDWSYEYETSMCAIVPNVSVLSLDVTDLQNCLSLLNQFSSLQELSISFLANSDPHVITQLVGKYPIRSLVLFSVGADIFSKLDTICSTLTTLALYETNTIEPINDVGLTCIGLFCPLITDLILSNCCDISDHGLNCILINQKIKMLNLQKCNLTGSTLLNVTCYCFNSLKVFKFYARSHVTVSEFIFVKLLQECKQLRELVVPGLTYDLSDVIRLFNPKLKLSGNLDDTV